MKTSQLDEVDRQLLHALSAAPRASFRVLAEVVGVSDQTIARRYRRLTAGAGLRVLGLIDTERAGWVNWLVRLQAAPGSAQRIADALARRPDTRWVRLYSGGAEIVCTVQARTPEQRDALFLRGLPGSRHVTAITAHSILHVFTPVEYAAYATALSATQLASLREAVPETPSAPPETAPPPGTAHDWTPAGATVLRDDDDPLIAELARDGRAPVTELAAGSCVAMGCSTVGSEPKLASPATSAMGMKRSMCCDPTRLARNIINSRESENLVSPVLMRSCS